MERLIALATATRRGGAALFEGGEPVAVREINPPETGGAALLAGAVGCLEEVGLTWGDLSAVAVALGPGSFTGIRVGLATALGLAESKGLKLLGVGSLNCIVRGAREGFGQDATVCATLPAGRELLFAQLFRNEKPLGECGLVPAGGLVERYPARVYIGNLEITEVDPPITRIPRPDWVSPVHLGYLAWELLVRGEADDPAKISPLYVKRPAARPTARRRDT
jgi:tRNA threonylcarbamoyladenosine biosynthesis protein TsaB